MEEAEVIATRCRVEGRQIHLKLKDGRRVHFPASRYPVLRTASNALLARAKLRLGGRALRWKELDEDIWITSAVAKLHSDKKSLAA
jgi:hypothetical protein